MGIEEGNVDRTLANPIALSHYDVRRIQFLNRFKCTWAVGESLLNGDFAFAVIDSPGPEPATVSDGDWISSQAGNPVIVGGIDHHD